MPNTFGGTGIQTQDLLLLTAEWLNHLATHSRPVTAVRRIDTTFCRVLLMTKHWQFVLQVEYCSLITEQSIPMTALCGLLLYSINNITRDRIHLYFTTVVFRSNRKEKIK